MWLCGIRVQNHTEISLKPLGRFSRKIPSCHFPVSMETEFVSTISCLVFLLGEYFNWSRLVAAIAYWCQYLKGLYFECFLIDTSECVLDTFTTCLLCRGARELVSTSYLFSWLWLNSRVFHITLLNLKKAYTKPSPTTFCIACPYHKMVPRTKFALRFWNGEPNSEMCKTRMNWSLSFARTMTWKSESFSTVIRLKLLKG